MEPRYCMPRGGTLENAANLGVSQDVAAIPYGGLIANEGGHRRADFRDFTHSQSFADASNGKVPAQDVRDLTS